MNAVIRAVVRIGLRKGFKVFLINEGYNGLIKGGDYIKEAEWLTVDYIIDKVCFLSNTKLKFQLILN